MAGKKIRVSLHVEGFGQSSNEVIELDREELDGMTAGERDEYLDQLASDHAGNYVGYGWCIEEDDDD